MMTPEEADKQRRLDEEATFVSTNLPPLWRALYLNCVEQGFSEMEAFSLTKVFIATSCSGGVHIHRE